MPVGTVYLVGAGPGAADLLTLRAARILGEADIVFHDALVHPATLALAGQAVLVAVGKRCGRHSTAQRFINKRLVDAAHAHAVVVRLKGGDPMLFGRAQEEIAALEAAGVPVQVVPGVSAAFVAAATLKTSLTQRGSVRSVALVTARVGSGEAGDAGWLDALARSDAGAIYMGGAQAAEIAAALLAAGKPASWPVTIVENASLPSERVSRFTLESLAHAPTRVAAGPALLLAGPQFVARDDAVAARSTPGSVAPATASSDAEQPRHAAGGMRHAP